MRVVVIAGGNECIERMWKRKKKVKRRVIWVFKLGKEMNVTVCRRERKGRKEKKLIKRNEKIKEKCKRQTREKMFSFIVIRN